MDLPYRYVLDKATIWVGDGNAYPGHVIIEGDQIQSVETGGYQGTLPVQSLDGLCLSPGMIDLMVIGAFGHNLLNGDPLQIARMYLRRGVTAVQFCTGTRAWATLSSIAGNIRRARSSAADHRDAARVIGWYPEGPFQSPDASGANLQDFVLTPSKENVRRILKEMGDVISMINVSPGVQGDRQAVQRFRAAGKTVSMAHSNASAERVLDCVSAGASVLGHAWDNNSGLIGDSGVQQPTLEHVALTDDRVRFLHVICDGVHAHPIMVRLATRCRGISSICVVTDALPCAGCEDGPFSIEDGRVFHKRGSVGRTAEGALCGSALLLPDHFRNFVSFAGVPPAEAIRAVTLNPAASLGLDGELGLLKARRIADMVAWDGNLRVRRVWRRGREITNVSAAETGGLDSTAQSSERAAAALRQ